MQRKQIEHLLLTRRRQIVAWKNFDHVVAASVGAVADQDARFSALLKVSATKLVNIETSTL